MMKINTSQNQKKSEISLKRLKHIFFDENDYKEIAEKSNEQYHSVFKIDNTGKTHY